MNNKIEEDAIRLQRHFINIVAFIDIYKPASKPTLEFLGALMMTVVEKIDLSPKEIALYSNVYSSILKNQCIEKEAEKLLVTV